MAKTAPHASHEWVVTLAAGSDTEAAASALRAAGLAVEHVLTEIGVVTGTGPAALAKALKRVPHVADVARQVRMGVGPPDADVS